eukprot:XP_017174880.1 PREDICTED: uncharacterized protein Gm36803 [Mus musculus]
MCSSPTLPFPGPSPSSKLPHYALLLLPVTFRLFRVQCSVWLSSHQATGRSTDAKSRDRGLEKGKDLLTVTWPMNNWEPGRLGAWQTSHKATSTPQAKAGTEDPVLTDSQEQQTNELSPLTDGCRREPRKDPGSPCVAAVHSGKLISVCPLTALSVEQPMNMNQFLLSLQKAPWLPRRGAKSLLIPPLWKPLALILSMAQASCWHSDTRSSASFKPLFRYSFTQ